MDLYHIVITNPDSQKVRFESLITNLVNFQRFACFHESNKSLWILSTIAQNEYLKIQIRKSESLRILKVWTRKSGFASPNLKDSYRRFDS
jgi:hypothetical protein